MCAMKESHYVCHEGESLCVPVSMYSCMDLQEWREGHERIHACMHHNLMVINYIQL
jgi:hypothetical protein